MCLPSLWELGRDGNRDPEDVERTVGSANEINDTSNEGSQRMADLQIGVLKAVLLMHHSTAYTSAALMF